MSLDERIAKRKAEGWGLDRFVVKRDDESKFYYFSGTGFVRELGFAKPYISIEAASYDQKVAAGFASETKIVPVFSRTIKVKRGHSFSWALARMKEGKRVRAGRWDKRCSLRLGDEFFYTFVGCDGQSRKYELLSYDAADTWELAE